jgi:hypothetical protein
MAAAERPRVERRLPPPRHHAGPVHTPRDVQLGLGDRARGSLVVLSAAAASTDNWFRFEPDIDFTTTMPADQQPVVDRSLKPGARSP